MSLAEINVINNTSAADESGQKQLLPLVVAAQETVSLETIRYEIFKNHEGLMAICKQANVPTSIRNLIGGLIKLSGGKIIVRANDFEIASVFYQDETQRDALKKKVQRWRKALDKWQSETGITLVQFRSGFQTTKIENNGQLKIQNEKTEYHLIVLDLAAKVLARNDFDVNTAARIVLGDLPNLPSKLDETRKNPLTAGRCLNTGISWFRKSLEIARRDGNLEELIGEIQADYQNLFDEFLTEDKGEGGTQASYLELNGETLLDTISTINHSYSSNNDSINTNDESSEDLIDNSSTIFHDITSTDSIEKEVSPDAEFDLMPRTPSDKTTNLSMLEHALSHASRGFRVFPVYRIINGICNCRDGAECTTPAKHPCIMFWNKLATTDEMQIRKWWRQHRNANIGIATGDYNDENILVVLDVDTKTNGFESLNVLEEKFGKLPETLAAITGSKGRHFIFLARRDLDIRNIQESQKLGKGLDIRGINGFIVAVGSIHASGNRYEWVDENAPVAEMPEWMIEKLTAPVVEKSNRASTIGTTYRDTTVSISNFDGATQIIREHEGRNNFLFGKACHFFRNGYQKTVVTEKINSLNNTVCDPPVGKIEMDKLIYSAEKSYLQEQ